jgi:hypothetical protein
LELLTRNKFRDLVFKRDYNLCVFCNESAVDAHHILERRLWPDGGYYLNNGASVCEKHHLDCEMTSISVEDIREACNITKKILPPHLYSDQIYDKWGNIILINGQRLKGELFFDESVQKILAKGNVLSLFTDYVKYPRTYHLPWSQGMHDDDRMMSDITNFIDKRVIVTEKLDGENTTMYNNYTHARSINSVNHASRNWVKNFWSKFAFDIPKGWRICGENMYAKHSILYNDLKSYFYGFSIWNERNECLSWDNTLDWLKLISEDLINVPILYDGIFDKNKIMNLWNDSMHDNCEGYIMRVADSFPMNKFRNSVGKFVRNDHIQTINHWMHGKPLIKNILQESING